MHPIGIRLPDETDGYSIEDVVDLARLADSCGYHSAWVAELQGRNGLMTLTRIANETTEIGLGTGIINVYSRTPALIAMSVATLDEFSDGRALLGLAASSKQTIEDWHSIDFDRPLRRVRETIEIVRESMQNRRVNYHGELYGIEDYPRTFDPVRADVPIYNAALGETNRKLTGEFADGWLPVHVPRNRIESYIAEIEASAVAAGRDPDAVTIAPYVVACVDEDGETARRYARQLLSFYVGAIDYYGHVFREFGFGNVVEAVEEAWAAGDREEAARRVDDTLLDEVAIAGTPTEGRERLHEYRELGVDLPVIYPPSAPRDVVETTVRELAADWSA